MEQFFHLKERGTTVRIEVMAGVTTFVTMAYILMVNPGMFTALNIEGMAPQVTFGSIYIATSLSAVVGTVLIGLMANLPLAQASGMGLNAFFVYSVCLTLGFSYGNALVFVGLDGILFTILTITGARQIIFDAIPAPVKKAIAVGIGLFITFLGLQDSGLVVADSATGVTLASFNILSAFLSEEPGAVGQAYGEIMPLVVTIGTVIAMARLSKKGQKGAILISILGGSVAYYVLNIGTPGFYANFTFGTSLNPLAAYQEWAEFSMLAALRSGLDFSGYLAAGHSKLELVIQFMATSLAFCLVDMFDTLGTLYGACKGGDLLVKNEVTGEEEVPKGKMAMLADAIASWLGGLFFGTSTVTTFVESSAGVAAGGRTGLSSLVTAALFLAASFLSPLAALVPSCAYAAALIYIGYLMMDPVREIDWKAPLSAVPAFITIAVMPFTYSISYGIAFGLITYIGINVGQWVVTKVKDREVEMKVKIGPATWSMAALFVLMLLNSH